MARGDQGIDETIKLVDAEKARLLSLVRDEGVTPELTAQITALYACGAALFYQRQRQGDQRSYDHR